jgi:hypothetical protein
MGKFLLAQFLSLSNNPDTAGAEKKYLTNHPFHGKICTVHGTYRKFLAHLEKVGVQMLKTLF